MRTFIVCLVAWTVSTALAQNIDRRQVVTRHNPKITIADTLSSLTVGNGGFAFTVDATGLQSFPEYYSHGVPLGTMSDWGWHRFPNPQHYQPQEALVEKDFGRGGSELYSAQFKEPGRQKDAANWLRANPHRMHLGCLGLDLGTDPEALSDISEEMDLWSGIVRSRFCYEGCEHQVSTACHPDYGRDQVVTQVISKRHTPLLLRVPYPTGQHSDDGCNWNNTAAQLSVIEQDDHHALMSCRIDSTLYYILLEWKGQATIRQEATNRLFISPQEDTLSIACRFAAERITPDVSWLSVFDLSAQAWQTYWNTGGIVDLGAVEDPRAQELERRMVLSQYLLRVNDAGCYPPQETGLTYNSWFGKFHLEMIWWHQAQWALWNHADLLARSLSWYRQAAPMAREIAQRQGFNGLRWMKMTDPSAQEAPSNVGSYLIWQQPHLIYLSELLRRAGADMPTVVRGTGKEHEDNPYLTMSWDSLVEQTAEMMACFVTYDKVRDRYTLKGCIPAQETLKADSTVNPPFELAYWQWALEVAQQWRERSGKGRHPHWDDIIAKLSPLACNGDSLYLAAESATDTYTNRRMTSDHPAVLGALGVLPMSHLVNTDLMRRTLSWIWDNWNWPETWGWDYPMTAMTCARLGEGGLAVDALLMPMQKNTYLPNGHNYQDNRLRCYLPGNGGLLTAIAMMCAGWDRCTTRNPGWPPNWRDKVRWENLRPLP